MTHLPPEIWIKILKYSGTDQLLALRATCPGLNNLVVLGSSSVTIENGRGQLEVGKRTKSFRFADVETKKANGLEFWILNAKKFTIDLSGRPKQSGRILETILNTFEYRPSQSRFRVEIICYDFCRQFKNKSKSFELFLQFRKCINIINRSAGNFSVRLSSRGEFRKRKRFYEIGTVELGSKFTRLHFPIRRLPPWEWIELASNRLDELALDGYLQTARNVAELKTWLKGVHIRSLDLSCLFISLYSSAYLNDLARLSVDCYLGVSGKIEITGIRQGPVNWMVRKLKLGYQKATMTILTMQNTLSVFTFPQLQELTIYPLHPIDYSDTHILRLDSGVMRCLLQNLKHLEVPLDCWRLLQRSYSGILAELPLESLYIGMLYRNPIAEIGGFTTTPLNHIECLGFALLEEGNVRYDLKGLANICNPSAPSLRTLILTTGNDSYERDMDTRTV